MKSHKKDGLKELKIIIIILAFTIMAIILAYQINSIPKIGSLEFHNKYCPEDNSTDCSDARIRRQIYESEHCRHGTILGIIPMEICDK